MLCPWTLFLFFAPFLSLLLRETCGLKADGADLSTFVHVQLTGDNLPSCSIPQDPSINHRFNRLDVHNRGKITFNEFLLADQCAVEHRRRNFNNIDLSRNNKIDRQEWFLEAYQLEQEQKREKSLENALLFKFFDKNHNLKLDLTELKQYIRFRKCSAANANRYLSLARQMSRAEFNAFTYKLPSPMFPLSKRHENQQPYYGDNDCSKPETAEQSFDRLDQDKNNDITFAEYLHLDRCPIVRHLKKFSRLDINGDKFVTLAEFREFYREREQFWQNVYELRQVGVVHQYDTNNDMKLNRQELMAYLYDRNLDSQHIDYVLSRGDMTPQQFAQWEETLPNLMFPPAQGRHPPKHTQAFSPSSFQKKHKYQVND